MMAVFLMSEEWTGIWWYPLSLLQIQLAEDGGSSQAAGDVRHVR